jgi:hypothetical protein
VTARLPEERAEGARRGTRLLQIGRDLQSRIKVFFDNTLGADATPLELLHATLDQLEARIQPAGRGRRIFPYDRVVVRLTQPGADPAALHAIFDQLETRLRERLQELRCEAPETLEARLELTEPSADPGPPVITLECTASESRSVVASPVEAGYPPLRITVVKGQCAEQEYVFEEPVVAIGRTSDPTDAFGQVRHNHVAFLEQRDGFNETVGRAHARLQFDAESGHYHLFNEGSSNPTSIVRAGKTIRVAPRDPRGVRVRSGDQLQLGRAVLRVIVAREMVDGKWKME